MTVALWIFAIWTAASVVFVFASLWWVNRGDDTQQPVEHLYEQPRLEGRAVTQKPPRGLS